METMDNLSEDMFNYYLKEIAKYPLLTQEEEIELGQERNKAEKENNKIKYDEAVNKLINHNLRYVVKIAKKYQHKIGIEDAVQYGNIGLMTAAKKYDPSAGFRFTTYATWWIKQSITRGILNDTAVIKLPTHVYEKLVKVKKAVNQLESEQQMVESDKIATMVEASREEVEEILTYLMTQDKTASLDADINEEKDSSLIDFVGDEKIDVEKHIVNSDINNKLSEIINEACTPIKETKKAKEFADLEKEVVSYHYGLNGYPIKSFQEIADILHIPVYKVKTIEERLLHKLRNPVKIKTLKALYY